MFVEAKHENSPQLVVFSSKSLRTHPDPTHRCGRVPADRLPTIKLEVSEVLLLLLAPAPC